MFEHTDNSKPSFSRLSSHWNSDAEACGNWSSRISRKRSKEEALSDLSWYPIRHISSTEFQYAKAARKTRHDAVPP